MTLQGLIFGVVGVVFILLGALLAKRKVSGLGTNSLQPIVDEIDKLHGEMEKTVAAAAGKISRVQIESAQRTLEEAKTALLAEKETLKQIDAKLDVAQRSVEQKESVQQDLKSTKMDDEKRMAELLAVYEDISAESVQLEQQLAVSMKNLDQMMAEVSLTEDQRGTLQDLSNALSDAGSRLRDLIIEYQGVNERLQALQVQHLDLEEEYTRLVEQQLGE